MPERQKRPPYIYKGGHWPTESVGTLTPPPTGPAPGALVPPEASEESKPPE